MPKASIPQRILYGLTCAFAAFIVAATPSTAQLWPWGQPAAPAAPAPQNKPKPARPKPTPQPVAPKSEPAKAGAQPGQPVEEPPPPYEPELLRLAEILGALTYLRDICGAPDAESWRNRMQALLDAEAKTAARKEHLAGAYNRGFYGYEISYRVCTPNAQIVIKRFLNEGERIAHFVANRYGAS